MTPLRVIGRRLLEAVPVLFILSVLDFLLVRVIPGNPVDSVIGPGSNIPRSEILAIETQMGLNRPLPVEYWIWLTGVLRGNLGTSILTHQPVTQALLERLPVTAELAGFALVIGLAIALPLGVLAATHHNSIIDVLATVVSMFGLATPGFYIAILLIWLFSVYLKVLPAAGYVSPFQNPLQNLEDLLLPAFALGLGVAAHVVRFVRSGLLETLSEDYVRTARAKGAGQLRVVWRHAMRNTMLPLLTVVGLTVSGLMGGSLIMETIFILPGMGGYVVNGIFTRDFPIVQGGALIFAVIVVVVNIIVDILYGIFDPRVSAS